MPLIMRPKGKQLCLHDWWSNSLVTSTIDIAVRSNRTALEQPAYRRAPSGKLPGALALRHYEPARDFQTGVQRSERADAGRVATQIDFPVSLDANGARRLADLQLLQIHKSRDHWSGHAVFSSEMPRAGDWFADPGGDGRWQITEIEHLSGASRISAQRSVDADPARSYLADAGRSLVSPDVLAGTTNLVLMDLPALEPTDPGQPIIAIAAAGSSAFWRSASLSLQTDNGLLEIGPTAAPAIIGNVTGILPAHSAFFLDMHNQLEVQLLHHGFEIPTGNGNPLQSGASLCWVGGELIRIGRAEYLGGDRYRLSALQRGCFGTEGHISGHLAGENLVVLDGDSVRILDGTRAILGASLTIEALGIGDLVPAAATIAVQGNAIRPLVPVHGKSEWRENGDLHVGWIRRARIDPGWHDYVDVPLTDGEGQYSLVIAGGGQSLPAIAVSQSEYLITAAQLAAWGILPSAQLTFEVRHVGRYNQSAPLVFQNPTSA
jgi:Putative phage tail protein